MIQSMLRTEKLNVRLNHMVRKVITPVVLLAGVLVLAVYHFNGVLKVTTIQDNLFHGVTAYSAGPLQSAFQLNAGTGRPSITYATTSLMSYVDWNSTIAIDGQTQNLWDNYHGYSQDTARRQIFSTTSGDSWQVVEVVTLVNAQTVTVHYDLAVRTVGTAKPHTVVLTITHTSRAWYQPTVRDNVLTAGVLPGALPSTLTGQNLPRPIGNLRFSVKGPAVPTDAIALSNVRSVMTASVGLQSVASALTTTYQVTNPPVGQLIPLGTETITFSTGASASAPLPDTQSLP